MPYSQVDEYEDDGDRVSTDRNYELFIGNVVKIVDGHVKVHFIGPGKKDYLWFEQDSDHLFLDRGLTDPPTTNNEN